MRFELWARVVSKGRMLVVFVMCWYVVGWWYRGNRLRDGLQCESAAGDIPQHHKAIVLLPRTISSSSTKSSHFLFYTQKNAKQIIVYFTFILCCLPLRFILFFPNFLSVSSFKYLNPLFFLYYSPQLLLSLLLLFHLVLLPMEPWTAAKENFKLVWLCHQLFSGFLANGKLPRVSHQPRLWGNDKSVNEMMRAVHNSPGICLTAEENSGRPQLGHRQWRLCDQS